MSKEKKKTVALNYNSWKILKQYSLDMDKPIGSVLEELIEDNLR